MPAWHEIVHRNLFIMWKPKRIFMKGCFFLCGSLVLIKTFVLRSKTCLSLLHWITHYWIHIIWNVSSESTLGWSALEPALAPQRQPVVKLFLFRYREKDLSCLLLLLLFFFFCLISFLLRIGIFPLIFTSPAESVCTYIYSFLTTFLLLLCFGGMSIVRVLDIYESRSAPVMLLMQKRPV